MTEWYLIPKMSFDERGRAYLNAGDELTSMVRKVCEDIPPEVKELVASGYAEWDTTFKTTENGTEAITRLKRKEGTE